MTQKSPKTVPNGTQTEPRPKALELTNIVLGRLMMETALSPRVVTAWWHGTRSVSAAACHALERAAKRLRIVVPVGRTTKSENDASKKKPQLSRATAPEVDPG